MRNQSKSVITCAAIAVCAFLQALPALAATTITGAGATFPYPLYSRWAYDYEKENGVQLNYQSIGSGGGIAQIQAGTVDFGASDAPMKPDELKSANLVQWPMTVGGVVPVINVAGIEPNQLKMSGENLARIFMGQIKNWNDPALKAENPDLALPDKAISVVHRADGSGTTWVFTNYLAKVSEEWLQKVGTDKAVSWPVGVGGKGNEGVANYVQRIPNSIGYVELAFCLQNKMTSVKLKNADGNYVEPTAEAFQAAAANADWIGSEGFYVVLTNQPGAESWPITGASFILMQKEQKDARHAAEVLQFFHWAYLNGEPASNELHYVPIPENVAQLVQKTWSEQILSQGKPVWTVKTPATSPASMPATQP